MKVLQYPLTQITLFFVFGIIFNRYLNLEFNVGLGFLVGAFFVFFLVFSFLYRNRKSRIGQLFTVTTLILSFSIGNFSAVLHNETNEKSHYVHFSHISDEAIAMKVVLLERWKPTLKNYRYLAEVYNINDTISTGKVLVNFRKEHSSQDLKIGMKLAVFAKILPLQKPFNPDQFDYATFLKNKSIYGQVYIDDSMMKVFSTEKKNLYYYSAIFRNRVIENLKNSGFNSKELAVVQALILGQRQDIDPTVLQNYQYAGAVHILSVSGLHVGFVLLFLNYLLNFLPNSNRFRIFKVVVLIAILWCFALVAGFSPSVVRSVTMFSFVAIGMYMRRKTYAFYTFYCSIFLILLFEPSFLFDVGFQLSYMALFFILWLQPEFEKVWQPKNKIANHFWQVLTITFAAQLGTMPLSLYYFHQFPGLFFITNLLVMFLITIIMGVGLFFVLIAFWTEIPTIMAKVLEKLVWLLNYIIERIASFESFIFKDISFNFWMMSTLYLLIFALVWFFVKKNFTTSLSFLVTILIFQISYLSFAYNSKNKEEWMVFHERNNSLILERKGSNLKVWSDIKDSSNIEMDRNIQSYTVAHGAKVVDIQQIPNLMTFHSKNILIIDSNFVFIPQLKPHVIVIRQSPKVNFERVLESYNPEIVIADASNFKNVVERIRKTCAQQKIPFHGIAEKGFYSIEH